MYITNIYIPALFNENSDLRYWIKSNSNSFFERYDIIDKYSNESVYYNIFDREFNYNPHDLLSNLCRNLNADHENYIKEIMYYCNK